MTREEFIDKANLIHNNKYDYSKVEYKNNYTKVCIICPDHGEFWQTPKIHLHGKCPKCALEKRSLKESFINFANLIHNNKYDYSKVEYKNNKSKVCIICPKHGEFWQNVQSHLKGYGCPECSKENHEPSRKMSQSEFIEKATKVHKNKYNYSKVNYELSTIPVTIICPKHGEFLQQPVVHLRGHGCPKCRSSKGELKLIDLLSTLFPTLEVIHHYKSDWLEKQHLDIYLPKYNIGIEYNGKQHYCPISTWGGEESLKNSQQRDAVKLQKCKDNNCILFIVSYDNFEEDWNKIKAYLSTLITGDDD